MRVEQGSIDLPRMEQDLLAEWSKDQVFEKSLEKRAKAPHFTFYDGPPFANGLPHYGHLLANTIKDTVPRYWTMRGFYVERRFGWDCHGVPVEYEIEKRENIKGRSDILKLGVEKFNALCKSSVQHYTQEWQKTITRLGRWVDWNQQYRTMDPEFMESVWWVVSQLWKKGLLYKDFKVVPYSPRISAVLSNFEANQNYKDLQDPAVTVKFKLKTEEAFLLAWTTTPWTLISNLGLCLGPDIDYVKIQDLNSGEFYYLAEARVEALYKKGGSKSEKVGEVPFKIVAKLKGKDLLGKEYLPIFPYFKDQPNAFRVLNDSYVSTEDGTGIVHQAPAYGEDDFRICKAANIGLVDPVDDEGCFKAEIPEFQGQFVKDADKNIIRLLKENGHLVRHDQLVHSYPFCERTDTPLIYKAVSTWYVNVEKIKDNLISNNQKINWVPEHLKEGRMGKWLENARDWAISRNRFWGTPLPIWLCSKSDQHIEVIESIEHLYKLSGTRLKDLHIDQVDPLEWSCSQCGGTMRRVSEVLDCWFESGSMPYAQSHYPFNNPETFRQKFPADFIAEGLDQTRGWFYTLSVLSSALFGTPAFKNVVVNGLVLAADGRKMSKRHKNYTPPEDLLDKMGADSVRLYMLNSPILKAGDLCFTDQGVRDTTRAVILPLWNAYSFLATYAQADGWKPERSLALGVAPKVSNELDRWIVSRLQTLVAGVHHEMEHYRLYNVVPKVLDFIEDLTNWYIRLSRKRFWGTSQVDDPGEGEGSDDVALVVEDHQERQNQGKAIENLSQDTQEAYQSLYYVLCTFTKVFAPFAPFMADRIYKNLVEGIEDIHGENSVHLCDAPKADQKLVDLSLENEMDLLRRVANLGRSLRAKQKIKTRQALASLLVITRQESDAQIIKKGAAILCSELNVKEIIFSTQESKFVSLKLKPNLKTLGAKLGKELAVFRSNLEGINQDGDRAAAVIAELEEKGEVFIGSVKVQDQDLLIERGPKDGKVVATEQNLTVLLDTTLTDELRQEGLAREVISKIQATRKALKLNVSDRIKIRIETEQGVGKAIEIYKDYISSETLAVELEVIQLGRVEYKDNNPGEPRVDPTSEEWQVDGQKLVATVTKA